MTVPTEVEAREAFEAWAQETPREWGISKQTGEQAFPRGYLSKPTM